MPDEPREVASFFGVRGVDTETHPTALPQGAFQRATNVEIRRGLPGTRRPVSVKRIEGDSPDGLNIQGARVYNPSEGQSAQTFGEDRTSVAVAAGGRKFLVTPDKFRRSNPCVESTEITGEGLAQRPDLHLVSLEQAENYLLAGDGNSDTWIYDGFGNARFSKGAITSGDRSESELANGSFPLLYAYGRVHQGLDGRDTFVGDLIHRENLTSSENILMSTEQVHWATGQRLVPASALGEITALKAFPFANLRRSITGVFAHHTKGVVVYPTNIFPRENWAQQAQPEYVLLNDGARGPYAVTNFDNDQFFRGRRGLKSLKFSIAEEQQFVQPGQPFVGPLLSVGEPVQDWFRRDFEPYLRFTSVEPWESAGRLFVTVAPWVRGEFRGSRGFLSLNFHPVSTQAAPVAWEGLWTMPPFARDVVQFVNGLVADQDRMFALCHDSDHCFQFAEIEPDGLHDTGPDGEVSRISCQLVTRRMSAGDFFSETQWDQGMIYLEGVEGEVDLGVWAREDESDPWTFWRGAKFCPACEKDPFNREKPYNSLLSLGVFPDALKTSRTIEFLVRWRGHVRGVIGPVPELSDGDGRENVGALEPKVCYTSFRGPVDYDDFEYNYGKSRWEEQLACA